MKILIATNHYFGYTGTETFASAIALQLKAKGHAVELYSPNAGGPIVRQTQGHGVPVFKDLKNIRRKQYDVVHLSHNTIAFEIRNAFDRLPLVYHSHGILPFLEQPPHEDLNISAYLAVSEEVEDNLVRQGIDRDKVVLFRNMVDTERFWSYSPISDHLRKLLIISGRMDTNTRQTIEKACTLLGIEILSIGESGKVCEYPESYINRADIVVSLGRGIIEAMACGRAALVFDYQGADGMVTRENLAEIQKCNFSGRRFKKTLRVEELVRELKKYSPDMGRINRALVEEHFSANVNIDKLLAVYHRVCDTFQPRLLDNSKINYYVRSVDEARGYASVVKNLEIFEWETGGRRSEEQERIARRDLGVHMHRLESAFAERTAALNEIYHSRAFKLIMKYYNLRDALLPPGSRRRRWFQRAGEGLRILKKEGILAWWRKMREEIGGPAGRHADNLYRAWIKKEGPPKAELAAQRKKSRNAHLRISIVVSAGFAPERELERTLQSLAAQTHAGWDICLAVTDDRAEAVKRLLDQKLAKSASYQIIRVRAEDNEACRLNAAAARGLGAYFTFLKPGVLLTPNMLYEMVWAAEENPRAEFLYADEDELSQDGRTRREPRFKPDWSPDTLLSYNYIGQPVVLAKSLLESIGGFQEDLWEGHEYDLVLRATGKASGVRHVPKILCHGRPRPQAAGLAAASPVFSRSGPAIRQALLEPLPLKPLTPQPGKKPKLQFSLVILNKNAPEFILPLLAQLNTPELNEYYEVVIGDTGTTDPEVLEGYRQAPAGVRVVSGLNYHFSRNYNELIDRHVRGKWVGIMNNDIVLKDTRFLRRIETCFHENTNLGAVGTKLLYLDGRLQHGGIFFLETGDFRGLPYHRLHGQDPAGLPGQDLELVPAVTGSFLFCSRADYLRLGGFDEGFEEEAQDVDLCLKFRRLGRDIAFLDLGKIIHVENATRPKWSENPGDRAYFIDKWTAFLEASLFYTELNNAGPRI